MKVIEGSRAVAETVKACRPQVISAYPITPQTHIVEDLSQMIADGELQAEYVKAESEFSAASVVLGASATGARAYTATASQGLVLMTEVLYNIAGMRLPLVMTVANRALSAPINIWNDQQDSISVRDSGWIQLYAEDNQEACDMHVQAFKIAEDHDILLPTMVCMDGYVLTHTYEPVELLEQEMVDTFLPRFKPTNMLTAKDPKTFGAFAAPDTYTEFRYTMQMAMENAKKKIPVIADGFRDVFGRYYGGLIDEYRTDDADILVIAMGSIVGTIKDAIDEMRNDGIPVGLVKVRTYRPFPKEAIIDAVSGAEAIAVLDKDISIGHEGAVFTDVKSALYNNGGPLALGFVLGLGGRDITRGTIKRIVAKAQKAMESDEIEQECEFIDLNREVL
jgi:pyruvate ferredoxin oxidoreductase alpha subunit